MGWLLLGMTSYGCLRGDVIISEFMASNGSTILDEDGDSSDWLEIYNSGVESVDLTGWYLSNNADDLSEWRFPSVKLPAKGLLLVWASGKDKRNPDQPLHTNFSLNADGEYLALVHFDGQTVIHTYGQYPKQHRDVSYGQGQRVTRFSILPEGADLKYRVVDSGAESDVWHQPDFSDEHWASGALSIGYRASVPGFAVRNIQARTTVGHLDTAEEVMNTPSLQGEEIAVTSQVINFFDTGGTGNFGSNDPFPGMTIGQNAEDFVVEVTGNVEIPESGVWTFGVNSDDGFSLDIAGQNISFPTPRAPADTLGSVSIPTAGSYPMRLLFYERGGGAGLEFFAAKGRYSSFNASEFELVGDVEEGGLEVWSAPAAGGDVGSASVETDLLPVMYEKHGSFYARIPFEVTQLEDLDSLTMRMRYDDGFVAFLNGVEVARQLVSENASWDGLALQRHASTEWERFELSGYMEHLREGENLLAFQVFNANANDASVFLNVLLDEFEVESGVQHYFTTSTPGALNAEGSLAFVGDTKFSQDRGFYTEPFSLIISTETEDAVIRYTLDGTDPSLTNGQTYQEPLNIDHTTTVRARAFRDGYEPSNTDTQTYFFLEDVIRQASNGRAPDGWPARWGSNTVDYGMDPDVVDSPLYRDTIIEDLKTLPSYSIVMDLDDLFGSSGIYSNPSQDGRAWERPCSVELIHPDGQEGFQINAGVRIRGGFSRSTNNPKHAFRLFFRSEYGASKLNYPVFGEDANQSFDAFDLRTFQNYSWSFQGDSRGIFLRDQFNRDLQLAMGHHAERGNFVHLYINGMYWGLYNTAERPEASYGEAYYGGDKEDYDVVKVEAGSYTINATDGNMDAWQELWQAVRSGLASDADYQRVQGNNPDGSRNPDYPVLVDVPNLIDYMLIILYGGNLDAPISNFLGNNRPNNFYSLRNRVGEFGFQHFVHDAEHTLLNVNQDRTGPYPAGSTFQYFNPQYLWQELQKNAEFRMKVADHIQKHMFNAGVLTPETATAMFMERKEEIDRAVVAESARWGDSKRAQPFTRDNAWINTINSVRNTFIARRTAVLLTQLKQDDLYPDVDAPELSQFGGVVADGYSLVMDSGNASTVYFTLNGVDPRLMGGGISPEARRYQGALNVGEHLHLNARGYRNGEWSALIETDFIVGRQFNELLVSEIMYHPNSNDLTVDGDDYEFIELKNIATESLDLSGVSFTDGIGFTFPNGTLLAPGEFAVLVRNAETFAQRYPTVSVVGQYTGSLNNAGERLTLAHASGNEIWSFTYDDQQPWPFTADGKGFSLVPMRSDGLQNQGDSTLWRASSQVGGSPGREDIDIRIPAVVVNELLSHTDPPLVDAVELFNPTDQSADIGGWYLTDNRNEPMNYQFPAGIVIPSGGFLLVDETSFNSTPGLAPSFTFSSLGESVYLFSADARGNLTGYSHGFDFDASENGVSYGRYLTSTGQAQYPPQSSLTLGSTNSGPKVGPVVINEIHFKSDGSAPEFVELKNVSDQVVPFFDPEHPSNTWRLDGIGFDFPTDISLAPGALMLIAGSEPAAFRSAFAVPDDVVVLGPFDGNLQNNGERLRLQRPDKPDVAPEGVILPMITVDEVRYRANSPWPDLALTPGASIERIESLAYGNDPINWRSSLGQPSPGVDNDGNRAPVVFAGQDQVVDLLTAPVPFVLEGVVQDDGLPRNPGRLLIAWKQVEGPGVVTFEDAHSATTKVFVPGVGTWVLELTASDGVLTSASTLQLTVERQAGSGTLVNAGSTWKYFDQGTRLPGTWVDLDFDDNAWESGRAQLGYGDGDEQTQLSFGGNAGDKIVTYYFRRTFAINNPASVESMTLRLLRDDGAMVYLNGREVFRQNLPSGTITAQTFASGVAGGADESTFYETSVDPALLVSGRNQLAVEVHQANASSSDISFDLELVGAILPVNDAPTILAIPQASGQVRTLVALDGIWSDDGLPVSPGISTIEWRVVSGPGQVDFVNDATLPALASFSLPGVYVLEAEVSDGELSSKAEVSVLIDDGGVVVSYSEWLKEFFTSAEIADSSVSGESVDADGDGHTNRQEFEAGTDPRQDTSVTRILELSVDDALQLHISVFSTPGRIYTLERSEGLGGGNWISVETKRADGERVVFDVSDVESVQQAYYRVQVLQQGGE